MAVYPRAAEALGSCAGRAAKLRDDVRELRLDLRNATAEADYADAAALLRAAVNALRRLEVYVQGGVAAPARGERP